MKIDALCLSRGRRSLQLSTEDSANLLCDDVPVTHPDDRLRLSRFVAGDAVRVRSGPFESFDGVVDGIDWEQMKLQVAIVVFGREAIVAMPPGDVERT